MGALLNGLFVDGNESQNIKCVCAWIAYHTHTHTHAWNSMTMGEFMLKRLCVSNDVDDGDTSGDRLFRNTSAFGRHQFPCPVLCRNKLAQPVWCPIRGCANTASTQFHNTDGRDPSLRCGFSWIIVCDNLSNERGQLHIQTTSSTRN